VHTPRRCGLCLSAGVLFFDTLSWRPLRTSCWIVGNRVSVFPSYSYCQAHVCLLWVPRKTWRFPGPFASQESPVSRRFHPSDLHVSALLRPPRSGVSRSAFGRQQRRLTGRQPTPIRIRTARERVHTASCTATGPGRYDPPSRRLLTRRHPRGDGHECKRYHPCARRPNWYWSVARLSTSKPTCLLERTRT
jgi:hypothetical protein